MKKIFLSMICLMLGGIAFAQNATFPQNITLKALDGSTVQSSAIQNDGKPIMVSRTKIANGLFIIVQIGGKRTGIGVLSVGLSARVGRVFR